MSVSEMNVGPNIVFNTVFLFNASVELHKCLLVYQR